MSTTDTTIINKIRKLIVKFGRVENLKNFYKLNNPEALLKPGLFSRNRKMPLNDMINFILYPRSESMNVELLKFSHLIGKSNVNKSDFSRQRRQIPWEYIKSLNTELIELLYRDTHIHTWHGHLAIAGDGTTYSLPDTPRLRDIYLQGRKTGHSAQAMARGVVLKDILNDRIIAGNLECYGDDEIRLLGRELDVLPKKVLDLHPVVVLDRKYCSYILLVKLMKLGIDYVIRIKKKFNVLVDKFLESGKDMEDVILTPAQPSIKKLHYLYGNDDYTRFKVRLIRLNKDVAVMTSIINLDIIKDFEDLYYGRWDVETTIGFDKNSLQVEIFSGISRTAMLQDYFAKTFVYNVLSVLVGQAAQLRHDTGQSATRTTNITFHRINRNVALGILALNFTKIIIPGKSNDNNFFTSMLNEMARFMVPVLKNRHNPRLFRNIKTSGKYITLPNYRRAI